jgi:hypothetical protein
MLRRRQVPYFLPCFAGGCQPAAVFTSGEILAGHLAIPNVNISPFVLFGIILFTAFAASVLTAFWLRRRVNASVRPHPLEHSPAQEQPPAHAQPTSLGPDFRPVKLTFASAKGTSPVMEISALAASALPQKKHRLDPSTTPLRAFQPFFQLVPQTLTAAEFGRGNYLQVLVHGPLALASNAQSFLPFVRGEQGRVEELARLKNGDQLRQMIGSGMGWQLTFRTVAQRHLADINRKLDYIRRGVEEIKKFLANERRSKIAGALDYLRQVVKSLGQGDSATALRIQLENVERDLLQIQNQIMRDLETSAGKIAAIIQSRFESRRARVKTIQQRADEMCELEKEWLLCVLARSVNWQVLCVIPGEKQFKMTRKEDLYRSIDEFTGFLRHGYQQLYDKIVAVRSVLDSFSSTQQDKSLLVQFDLRRRLIDDSNHISSDAFVIREEIGKFANQLWSPQDPIVLALRLDQGRIVEAFEIGAG